MLNRLFTIILTAISMVFLLPLLIIVFLFLLEIMANFKPIYIYIIFSSLIAILAIKAEMELENMSVGKDLEQVILSLSSSFEEESKEKK